MYLEEFAVPIMVAMQSFIILVLWSIHERLVKIQERQEACVFCRSDTSADEFKCMKEAAKIIAAHGNPYIFNSER